jgi:SAM-dependent methyltransferase
LHAARAAAAGSVLGIDQSSAMLAYARRRAADGRLDNISFVQADAQIHPFEPGAFDVAISNTGATFFGDLRAGFTNIAGALRSGGRLALLTWPSLPANEWSVNAPAGLPQAANSRRRPPTRLIPSHSPIPTGCAASSPPLASSRSTSNLHTNA